MRPISLRRGAPLAVSAAAAMLLFTGCAQGAPGAAAVVGGEPIGNDRIEAGVAEYEELLADSGQRLSAEQRSQVVTELLSLRIVATAMEQMVAEEGGAVTDADEEALLAELGGRETLAAQQQWTDSRIDTQVTILAAGDALIDSAERDEFTELQDELREELRTRLTEEGRARGIDGDELEQAVADEVDRQEATVRVEASTRYVNDRVSAYLADAEVHVSPRYGAFDPAALVLVPGASALSAPEGGPGLVPFGGQ